MWRSCSSNRTQNYNMTSQRPQCLELDSLDSGNKLRVRTSIKEPKCRGLGIILISGTTFAFATSMFIVKLLSNVSPMIVMLGSSLVQFSIYLPNTIASKCSLSGIPGERHLLFLRAFFGVLAVGTQYYSITLMPLVDASTIVFSYPAFVGIFGCLILKERCSIFQAVTTIFILFGVILVTKPTFIFGGDEEYSMYHLLGAAFAFCSCLSQASVAIVLRKLQRTPAPLVTLYFSIFNIIGSAMALLIIRDFRLPSCGKDGILITFSGFVYAFGQIFYTIASKIEKAGILAIIRSMDIVLTFILQLIFLGDVPSWNSYLGGGIIFFCVLLIAVQKVRKDIRNDHENKYSTIKT